MTNETLTTLTVDSEFALTEARPAKKYALRQPEMNALQTLASLSGTMTPEQRERTRNAINAVISTVTDPDAIATMELFREYHFGAPGSRKAIEDKIAEVNHV